MNRFAIFTACIGDYDEIIQPLVSDCRFDFYVFTNDVKEDHIGVWQVKPVKYCNDDLTRVARYVKTHPEELLPSYEATLWLDANIKIMSSWVYDRFISLYECNIDMASVQHPVRDCIYDEAYKVVSSNTPWPLEHDTIAVSLCHKIWKDGYPRHNGLYETGVLYRRNNELVSECDKLWWNIINDYSKRDQLSFNYVIWKTKPAVEFFLPIGEHVKNSIRLSRTKHGKTVKRKYLVMDFWELLRYRIRYMNPAMESRSERQWHVLYKCSLPKFAQWIWGCVYGLWFSPKKIGKIVRHRVISH